VLLFSLSLPFPKMLLGMGGGILLGALLGFVGLRLTRFETTEQGHFYTPNTHIGVALSLLFVGRMLYRIWLVGGAVPAPGQPQLFQSPLTLFIFGLIAGYYLVYYIGLFVHTHERK
jgi:NhaP-type Na+/H+ or K+/H+ antiporter